MRKPWRPDAALSPCVGSACAEPSALARLGRAASLPDSGVDLPGVFALRDIADATAIRERLGAKPKVVIIGAGFIGLEIAATAASLGAEATVVEIARPMGRAAEQMIAQRYSLEAVLPRMLKLYEEAASVKLRGWPPPPPAVPVTV